MKTVTLEQLTRQLAALDETAVEPILVNGMTKAVRFVRDDARLRAPVDTGELRRSITPSVKADGEAIVGEVSTNLEYAAYVEFGTGQRGAETNTYPGISYREDWIGQEAQPYLYPALKDNETQIVQAFFAEPIRAKIKEATR